MSIRSQGVLQPIIVRPRGEYFEIIAGHRRYEACKQLCLEKVPCMVREMADRDAYEVALIENIQRETLDPVEEAEAFKRYVLEYGWGSVTQLAKRIGKSEEYVSHRVLLLQLPAAVLERVKGHELNPSAARELVWLKDPVKQKELADLSIEQGLKVRTIRQVARFARAGMNVGEATTMALMDMETQGIGENLDDDRWQNEWTQSLQRTNLILRVAMLRLDTLLEGIQQEDLRRFILDKRFLLHQLIDSCIRKDLENGSLGILKLTNRVEGQGR